MCLITALRESVFSNRVNQSSHMTEPHRKTFCNEPGVIFHKLPTFLRQTKDMSLNHSVQFFAMSVRQPLCERGRTGTP